MTKETIEKANSYLHKIEHWKKECNMAKSVLEYPNAYHIVFNRGPVNEFINTDNNNDLIVPLALKILELSQAKIDHYTQLLEEL